MENHTTMYEFVLAGFSDSSKLQIPLFIFFLAIYVITLIANLGMVLLLKTDPQLHTPMYFFLSNLSFVDFCYSTVVTPRMLTDFFMKRKTISLTECAVQMWFFVFFLAAECFLLAVMAYDRYIAISNPLLYTAIMSERVCSQLVLLPYLIGLLNATIHTSLFFQLTFCNNIINHFFCDIPAVISLSCSNTQLHKRLLFSLSGTFGVVNIAVIIVSYFYIFTTIHRIHSSAGRYKAFSTCSAHLIVVTIFYGTLFFTYVCPSSRSSIEEDKMVSMLYTVMIPMLNPLVYSLRNKEVKEAVRRVFRGKGLL